MQRRQIFYSLLLIWLALFAYSFYAPAMVEATGDGFLRGTNRLKIFLSWHITALAFAAAITFMGSRMPSSLRRWISRAPLFLHIVAAAAITSLALQAYQAGKAENTDIVQRPKQAGPSSQ